VSPAGGCSGGLRGEYPPRVTIALGTDGGSDMTTKDTGGQRQTTRRAEETEEAETGTTEEVRERQEKLADDVDAILDEIDEVLEENAEEFVRSYVQKGGQ
jgi:prokaryotic ubiquitin-like protein Pup